MKGVRNLREMTRILDTDHRLRRLCLVEPCEKGYIRSVLSRFILKLGENRLITIVEEKVALFRNLDGAGGGIWSLCIVAMSPTKPLFSLNKVSSTDMLVVTNNA